MTKSTSKTTANNSNGTFMSGSQNEPIARNTKTLPKLHYFKVELACNFNCEIQEIFISTLDEDDTIVITPDRLPELLAIVQRLQSYVG